MSRPIRQAAAAVLVLVACSLGSGAANAQTVPPVAATTPTAGALYTDGPDGRYLLGGQWLFRADPQDVGLTAGYASSTSQVGWSPVTAPNAWNATDMSDASMAGSVGWYRRDFLLPDTSKTLRWIVRFESVNFSAQVWLNGRPIGTNVGAFLPFELPLSALNRHGINRLVIRVDNRIPPTGDTPQPPNGWWNYGGLLREVYIRSVDRVDFAHVTVTPTLRCARCSAQVAENATIHNYSSRPQTVHLTGTYGALSLDLGTLKIPAGQDGGFSATAALNHPKLWSPAHPNLYTARLVATAVDSRARKARPTRAAGYTVLSGVRSIQVSSAGRLLLNFRPVHLRGVSIVDDNPIRGGALNNADRARIVADARDLGATMIRSQYPLHPELEELADRDGLLVWSQIPIYQLGEQQLADRAWITFARSQLAGDITANQNHPSIVVWSIANELPTMPGPKQDAYNATLASLAKRLDPTRLVGTSIAVNPIAGCRAADYAPLDLLGFDDYFGWYTGPQGDIADRDSLSSYLDSLHACYPRKALMVAEFGAEANRSGPVEEKGTYAFQSDFVRFHLGVYATKPWLAGAIYFTLREFRVQPGWMGGDPWASPPLHQKGLISFGGVKKPAYFVARQLYHATRQYG